MVFFTFCKRYQLMLWGKFVLGLALGFILALVFHYYPDYCVDFLGDKLIEQALKVVFKALLF
jgi:hypothetical protein